jgi:hypothetical protein
MGEKLMASGPWDDYAPAAPASGPWNDYAPAPSRAPLDPSNPPSAADLVAMGYHQPTIADEASGINTRVREVAGGIPFMDRAAAGLGAATGVGGTFGDYSGNLEKQRQLDAATAASDPTGTMQGNAIGGVLGAMAMPIPGLAADAGLASRVGMGAATGAGVGGIQGASQTPDLTNLPDLWGNVKSGAEVGGLVGGALPFAGAAAEKLMSPMTISPERQRLVSALQNEGIDTTAGQATGSRPLQWAESALSDAPLGGKGYQNAVDQQGQQFTSAAMNRMGVDLPPGELATPDVFKAGKDAISKQFEDLGARNTMFIDPQLQGELQTIKQQYEGMATPAFQRPIIGKTIDDITKIGQTTGVMPGTQYNGLRSDVSQAAKSMIQNDPQAAIALRGIRDSLDNAMQRSSSPQDAAAWQQARSRWGDMKTIENSMARGTSEGAAMGYIAPAQLRTAAASGPANRGAFTTGQSDLGNLAKAGSILKPLPQSGTAPRANAMHVAELLGGIGGALGGGFPGAAIGLGATAAAPGIAGRAIMSRPAQSYLKNQAARGLGRAITPRASGLAAALMAKHTTSGVRQR